MKTLAILGSDMAIMNGANQMELVRSMYGFSVNRIVYMLLSVRALVAKWHNLIVQEESTVVLILGQLHPNKGLECHIKTRHLFSLKAPNASKLNLAQMQASLEQEAWLCVC